MRERIRTRLRELVMKAKPVESSSKSSSSTLSSSSSATKLGAAGAKKAEPRRLRLLKIAPYLDAHLLGIKEFDKWNPVRTRAQKMCMHVELAYIFSPRFLFRFNF